MFPTENRSILPSGIGSRRANDGRLGASALEPRGDAGLRRWKSCVEVHWRTTLGILGTEDGILLYMDPISSWQIGSKLLINRSILALIDQKG